MSRIAMVTRTIKITKISFLCVNLETREVEEQKIEMLRAPKSDIKLLEKMEEILKKDKVKPISILNKEIIELKMGMTEMDFAEHAEIINLKNEV